MNTNQTAIDAFECAGAALEQAERYYQSKEAADQRARERIQPAVEACVRAGLLSDKDTAKLASALADPAEALSWLTKVADYFAQPAARMGVSDEPAAKPQQRKQAAASPFAGRRTGRLRDSDIRLFENLGLPVPTDE